MKRRIIVSQKKPDQQRALEFAIEKLGGPEAFYAEFYGEQLVELAGQDLTLAETRAEADKQGWLATLDGMKMTSIANIIKPSSMAPSRPSKPGAGKRLTQAEIVKVRDDVLAYLGENAWQSKNQIAEAIGFAGKKLGPQLKALRDEDKIKSEGEKAGMKYALKSEKTKPK